MSVFIVICLLASLCTGSHLKDIQQVIVRGTPINIEEAPFVAQYVLKYLEDEGKSEDNTITTSNISNRTCGASIVSEKYLVSSADCAAAITGYSVVDQYVIVGSDNPAEYGQQYEIEKATFHPKYSNCGRAPINDIIVIKLVGSLTFSSQVKSIPLAERDLVIPKGVMLEVYGYGVTLDDDKNTALNKLSIPYVETETCESMSTICAGDHPFMNADKGDYGGPLVFNSTLVGVASFGKIYERASVYTRVSALRDFIDEVMEEDLDDRCS